MGIVLGSNFDVQTALPLDSRLVVADLAARDAIDSLQRYEGMIVYVESEETNFQLIGGTANENWAELSGSGSGGGSGSGLNYISGAPEVYQGSRVITLGSVPVDETGDAVTATSHGITTGQKVRYDTDGTEIGGLTSGTTYYAISATANALQFATSYENAKAGTAIDLSSDGSGTQTLTVDLDEAIGGTPTVTVEETSDVSALTYKFSKDDADRFGEGLSFPVAIDAIDFEKTRKQIVTFFYKTSTDYVDRDIRVMLYDVENETFIEVKGGLDDNGELPASADIIEFRGYFHPASDSGNYRLAFNINSENTDAYDIYLGRVKITSEESIPVSGISPLIFGDDSHFEGTIGNWKKYKDAASEAPEDGDGGTPGIFFLRGTTKVLGGDAEGLLVHDGGSDYQGEGAALDIAVTPTNRAKDNKIQFFYSAFGDFTFGGFGSNSSVMVHLYDVTNGKHLNPYPGFLDGSGFYEGYCQIPHDCETIRLILHVATDSTAGWVLAVKKFQIDIAPNEFVKADSDWEDISDTVTFQGFGTPSNIQIERRRDGPDLLLRGRFTTGTVSTSEARVSFGSSGILSKSNLPALSDAGSFIRGTTELAFHGGRTLIEPGVNYITFSSHVYSDLSIAPISKATANTVAASNQDVTFHARVPIEGWTSGNLTAASANLNAPVIFTGTQSSQSLTASTTDIALNATKDTTGCWDGTKFKVKVPGDYLLAGSFVYSTNASMQVFKNGSLLVSLNVLNTSRNSGTILLENLTYGDEISLRANANGTLTNSYASIHRIETSGRVYKTRVATVTNAQSSGTGGGAWTHGSYQKLTLNTLSGDRSFLSISDSVVTLQPGTYKTKIKGVGYRVGDFIVRLRDTTNNQTVVKGSGASSDSTDGNNAVSEGFGIFTITSAANFELQGYCTSTNGTDGQGKAVSDGEGEVFAGIEFEKVL